MARGDVRGTGQGAAVLVAWLAVAAAVLVFVLRPLSLGFPTGGLDASWIAVLGEAATRPARWGVDLAFTYGPASALVTRYYTDGYLVRDLPLLLAVALAGGGATACLARLAVVGRARGGAMVLLAALGTAAGLAADLAQDQDSFYFALPLALLLLDLMRPRGDRAARVAVLAGFALLGALALAKTSFGVLALALAVLADARAAMALRRWPLLTPTLLAAALTTFLACGQRLGDLPTYLDLQGQVAAGYGEAMYLAPARGEILAFLAGAAGLVAVSALCGPAGRWGRATAALGCALACAVALKAGFIRADTHPQIAWSLLGFAALALAAGPALRRSPAVAAALGAAALALLWVAAPLFLLAATDRRPSQLPEIYGDMRAQLATELGAWGRALRSPAGFAAEARQAKAAAWAAIRAAQPLPALAGGVDMVPSAQSAVLANRLDYRPRPSFQEYSTYTAGLIAANARFYDGPTAPDWVIFGPGGLDDRYPTMTEGALWPALIERYEPALKVGDWVALKRRAVPLPDVLGPPVRIEARLGEPVTLPLHGPVYARITLGETLLGRLAAAVFRPPALSLQVTLAGGATRTSRFVPALAAGGFLLSPVVGDADGFAELAVGHGAEAGGAEVTGFQVGGSRLARLFYAGTMAVELRPVAVPETPPSPDAAPFRAALERSLPWLRTVGAMGRSAGLDGDKLSAPAPTDLTVPTEGARRLHLGFGIHDGAWSAGRTQGVCFAVAPAPGAPPLWTRCLDPAAVAGDRGPQSADLDLPPGLASVTAETRCPRSCDWGWSYWSAVVPAGG